MKKLTIFAPLCVAAALFLSPSVATAKEDKLALARAFVEANMASMDLNKIAAASATALLQQIKSKQPEIYAKKSGELRGIIERGMLTAMQEGMKGLDKTLASIFTVDELKAMKEFYSSEVGQGVLKKMPQYMAALQPAMQRAMQTAKIIRKIGTRLGWRAIWHTRDRHKSR